LSGGGDGEVGCYGGGAKPLLLGAVQISFEIKKTIYIFFLADNGVEMLPDGFMFAYGSRNPKVVVI